MLVTLSGIVISVKPEYAKALSPILVTLLGIVIDFNFEQLAKALFPILVTLSGIVISVKAELSQKE